MAAPVWQASASGITSIAVMPGHVAGDILIGSAFRDGNNNAPTVPGDWNIIDNGIGANNNGFASAWKRAAGSSETSGTWTSANSLNVDVYRGALASGSPIGGHALAEGSTNSINYPTISMTDASGNSIVIGLGGHRSTNAVMNTPPTGMTNRTNNVDATDQLVTHDTNGGVTSWPLTNQTLSGTASGWRTNVFELMGAVVSTPSSTLMMMGVG